MFYGHTGGIVASLKYMRTLILDIETVGVAWTELDTVTQRVLTRWIDRAAKNNTEHEQLLQDIKEGLGFSPLTGEIVALGVYDIERGEGTVYSIGSTAPDTKDGSFLYKMRSERELLAEFWEGVQEYEVIVTFNGRAFDLPFVIHRSVAAGITPTINVMKYRYLTQQSVPYHVDLQDQLTFYGAMMKRPSLHLFCQAYGIASPKVAGISGDDVAELFRQKKFLDIARYNARDLLATAELYKRWKVHLAPAAFKDDEPQLEF